MVSPCPAPRLIRCSMRDLASCFHASRFPLEKESDAFCSRQPMVSDDRSTIFNSKTDARDQNSHGKMSTKVQKDGGESDQHRSNSSQSVSYTKGSRALEGGSQAKNPLLSEEDYIVFYFRENGEIDMIGEGQSTGANKVHDQHTNIAAAALRPISRKLYYSEGIELVWDSRRGVMVNPGDSDIIMKGNKDEVKGSVKGTIGSWPWAPGEQVKDPNLHHPSKMDHPTESCGSNLSDSSSTESFTFPELGNEWIGSPVHLPKAENDEEEVMTSCCGTFHSCKF